MSFTLFTFVLGLFLYAKNAKTIPKIPIAIPIKLIALAFVILSSIPEIFPLNSFFVSSAFAFNDFSTAVNCFVNVESALLITDATALSISFLARAISWSVY